MKKEENNSTATTMSGSDILKVEFMVKRSQMKGRFKADNYKSRWFVLTPTILRYHDGTLEVWGNLLINPLSRSQL